MKEVGKVRTLTNPELHLSKHARFVSGNSGSILYHSLFSAPVIISPRLHRLLVAHEVEDVDTINLLKERYLLVGPETDERKLLNQRIREHYETLALGSQLRQLDLSVSEVCNFGCQHCIHAVSVGASRRPKMLMDWDTAKDAIDKYMSGIESNGWTESEIHFGTVEPLINWQLIERCVDYCEQVYPHIRHQFYIETNLSLLNVPMAEFLKKHGVRIATSIDGYKAANDAIRITAGGEGTFDWIEEKCRLLRNIGHPLTGFTLTITDRNFQLVDLSIVEWACKMGMTEIDMDIDLLSSTGLSVEQCVDKIIFLHREYSARGLKTTGTWKMPYMNLINKMPLTDSVPPSLCPSAGGQNIAIAPNGKIFVCGHSSTEVGDLARFNAFFDKEGAFLQLISSRLSGQNEMCIGCEIESQCAGQCQVTREVASKRGDNRKVEFMCDFYRKITKVMLTAKVDQEYPQNASDLCITFPQKEQL
jgi:radical SAM protein with 4Fe4S-binding SPASM domain